MTDKEKAADKKAEKKSTEDELRAAREKLHDAEMKERELTSKLINESRPSGLDSFQEYQRERTEEEIVKQLGEDEESPVRMSPGYAPPGTVRGTEGDNANYNPQAATAPNADEEWDPHGGEKADKPEKYDPSPIPGEAKK